MVEDHLFKAGFESGPAVPCSRHGKSIYLGFSGMDVPSEVAMMYFGAFGTRQRASDKVGMSGSDYDL
jgi:hypothetical protein